MSTPAPAVIVATDKPAYNHGDPISVTVEYADPANPGVTVTLTAVVTAPGGATDQGTATIQVGGTPAQPFQVSVSDSDGNTYTQLSSAPGTAVFTGTLK